jgi:hypothetical protein
MSGLSTSFILGKASVQHGANVEHNNREFTAKNIDIKKTAGNITYVKQDIHDAYGEIFGAALAEYNTKQKQPCRRINDYYQHVSNSKREEAFYEIVVQFGDSKTAPCGSKNGELVEKMLDEYIRNFKKRNPNLHIFNAVMHLDEASPHLHIDVIPFTTQPTKNGLSKRVSMKSALNEQGFTAKNFKENRLVAWEASEMKEMEKILNSHHIKRDIKNANYAHQTVEQYKEKQDAKKLHRRERLSPGELTEKNIRKLQLENSLLKVQKQELTAQKNSPYKAFYYSSDDKKMFVQTELDRLQIPYRETENGFEAPEYFAQQIRETEKKFKPAQNPYRTKLCDDTDKFIMQSKTFGEFLERMKKAGYEIKQGKYLAAKPKSGSQFIRLKSLGEDYSEQALRNRIVNKLRFENEIDSKINSADNQNILAVTGLKTVRQYTLVFARDVLPVRRKNPKKPFSWTNDAELEKISALNKKLNGVTLDGLRNEFRSLEKSAAEKEKNLAELKKELAFFEDLYAKGRQCFEENNPDKTALETLAEHKITAENYMRIEKLVTQNRAEVAGLEKSLAPENEKLQYVSDMLSTAEKIAGGTYVQSLIAAEKDRRQSEFIRNGLK